MQYNIALMNPLPAGYEAQAQALAPGLCIYTSQQLTEHSELIAQLHILYGRMPVTWWALAKQLKWIQTSYAGVEGLLTPEGIAHPALLTNARIHGETIAEHLFGMLLSLFRQLPGAYRQQLEQRWSRIGGIDILAGKTLGIIGTGAIGRRAAEIGKAFNMRVLGLRVHDEPLAPFDEIYTTERLHELLPQCDVVMLTIPLTARTRRIISAAELAVMKPGAVLLNIGRGLLIDTDALVAALTAGWLGGAALDVTDPEPLPAGHPLWTFPNVLITPHVAGSYPGYDIDAAELFLENMRRFIAGAALVNQVDKVAGY